MKNLFVSKGTKQKPKSLEAFKMKAQTEQESLDNLISGLMGNCHDGPLIMPISSSASPMICECEIE